MVTKDSQYNQSEPNITQIIQHITLKVYQMIPRWQKTILILTQIAPKQLKTHKDYL